jgi:anti-sigma B factor antagonist
MQITTRMSGSATIVDVIGDITLYSSPEFRNAVITTLKDGESTRVVVNLRGVRYIDSAGVASLVEGLKISRELNKALALYGLSVVAREVLELTRLINVFEVHDTEEGALAGKPAEG